MDYNVSVPNLVSIAQAVFLLECGHTDRQTNTDPDATDHSTDASAAVEPLSNYKSAEA